MGCRICESLAVSKSKAPGESRECPNCVIGQGRVMQVQRQMDDRRGKGDTMFSSYHMLSPGALLNYNPSACEAEKVASDADAPSPPILSVSSAW